MTEHRTAGYRIALVSALLCALPGVVAAQAQLQGPPPSNFAIDERGVDLIQGSYNLSTTDVMIGQPGAGGLVYSRAYVGPGWRDSITGTIEEISGGYYVSIGGVSEIFTLAGGVFVPTRNVGATLVDDGFGGHVFTTSDGVVYVFSAPTGSYNNPTDADKGRLASITYPNGEIVSYNYKGVVVATENPNDPRVPALRVQSISNNRGYQIQLSYQLNTPTTVAQLPNYYKVTGATGFNLAVDYCAPNAVSCTFSRTWPSATYSVSGATQTVTDQSGRVTTYSFASNSIATITAPGSSSADVTVSYSGGLVSSVASATGTWSYAYATSGSTRTTTVTDPFSNNWTAVSDLSTGLLTSWTNPLSQTVSYLYDGQGRQTRVTMPEGNRTDYTYDGRGNVTQVVVTPKSGSGLSPITTSTTYPSTCSTPVTCNKPVTTTDERGNVTDYVWNSTHGGLESETAPLPSSTATVRPQTRVGYAAQTAYYKNSSGVIVAAPSSITLPVSTSACAANAAPACIGTSDETKTVVVYGSTGVANNLLPTSATSGDGTGTLAVTTATTYDPNGDIATVDGPLSGTNDTTRFVYDAARQQIGVIGPDPDGAGALLNRAQRTTYNARGQVTLAEAGTTTGNGAGDWSSFSTLQRQAVDYDAWSRPVVGRQQDASGNTLALQQVGYDAAGRTDCVATRMNPAAFSSLPGSTGACSQTAAGWYGPDRIVQTAYDAAGRPVSSTSGVGTASPITEAVTYTANGQLESLTDGKGNVSILVYDGFDRVSRLRYPNATGGGTSTADYEEYGYDGASNVIYHRDRAGRNFGMYIDNLNRLGSVYSTDTPASIPQRFYAYDNLNRPLHSWTPTGPMWAVYWGWDALNRKIAEQVSDTSTHVQSTVSYGYDAAGRRTYMQWPDGFYVNYDWSVAGDLMTIRENGNTTWALAAYTYDNLGRRTGTSRNNGANSSYAYDGVSRLASLTNDPSGAAQDVSFGFAYNPAGQIVSRSVSNNAYVHTLVNEAVAYVNDLLNRLTAINGSAVDYDANGNLTTAPGATYGYDAENRLTSSTTSLGGAAFAYDPTGRLYRSTGSADRRFLYDGQQVIAEYDGSGVIQNRYVPGLGLDDVVTSYDASGDRTWLLADERGSVVALTDGSGVAVTINSYDDYGVPSAYNTGRFQYTGQIWLPDAQLYHYRARAYAPQIGRFLQTDPMGYEDSLNLYAYVGADPINWVDPFGEERFTYRCVIGSRPITGPGLDVGVQLIWGDCSVDLPDTPTDLGDIEVVGRRGGGGGSPAPAGPTIGDIGRRALRCAADHYGVTEVLAGTGIIAGLNTIPTRAKMGAGATAGTSLASLGARAIFGDARQANILGGPAVRFFGRLPSATGAVARFGSRFVGPAVGRAIPVVGWAFLAYDAASIAYCTATSG